MAQSRDATLVCIDYLIVVVFIYYFHIFNIYSSKSALVLHAWKRSRVTGDYACGGREVFGPSAQWSLWYAHHITRRVFPATSTAAAGIATAGIATTGAKG